MNFKCKTTLKINKEILDTLNIDTLNAQERMAFSAGEPETSTPPPSCSREGSQWHNSMLYG